MEVHHIVPFHVCALVGRPELELDPHNLVTLCSATTNHHLLVGHLDDFSSMNLHVEADARRTFHGLSHEALLGDARYRERMATRPKDWHAMTEAEREGVAAFVEARFGKAVRAAGGG